MFKDYDFKIYKEMITFYLNKKIYKKINVLSKQ